MFSSAYTCFELSSRLGLSRKNVRLFRGSRSERLLLKTWTTSALGSSCCNRHTWLATSKLTDYARRSGTGWLTILRTEFSALGSSAVACALHCFSTQRRAQHHGTTPIKRCGQGSIVLLTCQNDHWSVSHSSEGGQYSFRIRYRKH
jgi:hypothetical protein